MRRVVGWREGDSYIARFTCQGSVLDDLRKLAIVLSRKYPWDTQDEIIRYVLTGLPPAVRPVTATFVEYEGCPFPYGTFRVEVAAWVPAEHVATCVRRMQAKIGGYGTRVRSVGERRAAVFRFVLERKPELVLEKPGPGRSGFLEWHEWESLRRQWNDDHPERSYGTVEGFFMAYKGAWREILQPTYQLPEATPLRPGRKRGGTYESPLPEDQPSK